jgi:hypothetical protein
MLSVRRWAVVVGGVAVLSALPAAIGALPIHQSRIGADQLLSRIRGAANTPYEGYAESTGGLALPVTQQFRDVADLFGGTTQLRAWYRGPRDWRVDAITVAGESDVHASPAGTWTWDYESNRATWTSGVRAPDARLPIAADLLPTSLARRLLSEAVAGQVHRLPAKRIAGRSAPGLRLIPHAPGSTIDHVDVWADERTGLALGVDVYGSGTTVLSTRFLDFSTRLPSRSDTAFVPPATAQVLTLDAPDIAAEINQFGEITPPPSLAGLVRNPALPAFGAIGVYGSGVTELVAVPLPDEVAFSLYRQLEETATTGKYGLTLSVGPLSLLLTDANVSGGSWLLTGTVTPELLNRAAGKLASP